MEHCEQRFIMLWFGKSTFNKTSFVRSIYVLCPGGKQNRRKLRINSKFLNEKLHFLYIFCTVQTTIYNSDNIHTKHASILRSYYNFMYHASSWMPATTTSFQIYPKLKNNQIKQWFFTSVL